MAGPHGNGTQDGRNRSTDGGRPFHDVRPRIKAVGSLPMASSSAACLVLTTSVHVLAGRGLLVICDICYPARRPGIIERAAGFSLCLVLFPPAVPGRFGGGPGLLGTPGPHPRQQFQQHVAEEGGGWDLLGCRSRLGSIRPSSCTMHGRAVVVSLSGKARVRCAGSSGRAQPCIRRVGVETCW